MTGQISPSKAIYVDGASVLGTKHRLGIDRLNFGGLYYVLTREVGTCRVLAHPPIMTIHPESLGGRHVGGLAKDVAGAGFELIPITSRNGADDKVIQSRIADLDPRSVSQVVLLSNDKDHIPVLRFKASQGVGVHLVGTQHEEQGCSQSSISESTIDLCKSGEFSFHELGKFIERIADNRTTHIDCSSAGTGPDNLTELTLSFRCNDRRQHLRLAGQISSLMRDFHGLKIKLLK